VALTGPVLVTGAGGLLGGEVVRALQASGAEVAAYAHAVLDIGDRDAVGDVVRSMRPRAVVNAAALTHVDRCESDLDGCRAANALGPGYLAEAAEEVGAEVVHVSTDYVFDGTKGSPYVETDTPSPLQTYGRCKLDGEHAVRDATARSYVLRTALVFGPGGRNFLSRLPELLQTGQPVSLVTDQVGSPTYAPDLAAAIVGLLGSHSYGLYHVSNAGGCTMVEFCALIAEVLGVDPNITELTRDDLNRPARRPADTRLDGPAWRAAGFASLRGWREAATASAAP